MMLGLLLARAGIEVAVLEKHGDFLRDFRGDTVHPATLRLLDELGLGARFAELPHRRMQRTLMHIGDSRFVVADFRGIPGRHRYVAMVPQWDFLTLLADAARREPTFTLEMKTEVTGLIKESGRIVGVRYRNENGAGELRAALIVACDGRGSVAWQTELAPQSFEVPMDVWQMRIPVPEDRESHIGEVTVRYAVDAHGMTVDRGDYLQTAYHIRKGTDAALRANGIDWLRTRLADLFGWDPAMLVALGSWDDVALLEVTMTRLSRWYTDGLLALGDAAHTMAPVGGVGVNLAIQDAVAAARLLAEPLRRGRIDTADLARVQRRRWRPTVLTQQMQHRLHETLLGPALAGRLVEIPPPWGTIRRVPVLARVMGFLGHIQARPEHAPDFARR